MSFLVLNDKFLRTPALKSGKPAFLIPSEPCETNNNRLGKDLHIECILEYYSTAVPRSFLATFPAALGAKLPREGNPSAPLPPTIRSVQPAETSGFSLMVIDCGLWVFVSAVHL